jgi:hypothetical protein
MNSLDISNFDRRAHYWEALECALEDLATAKMRFYESIKEMEQLRDRYRSYQADVQRAKEALGIWDEDI